MFLLKKLISRLFFPVPLSLLILLVGLGLLCFTQRQKTGKVVVGLGVAFLALVSLDFVPDRALLPLEDRNPPMTREAGYGEALNWVVVLSGGFKADPGLPMRLRCSESTLSRLVEGVVQHRNHSESRLLLSGGAMHGTSGARIMAETARALGVQEEEMVLESRSRDTAEQARRVGEHVGREPFLLVTSASHMPRAMLLFRQEGLHPIPAPAHFMNNARGEKVPWDYYPSHHSITKAQRAVYEYMGLAWIRIKDWFRDWARVSPTDSSS